MFLSFQSVLCPADIATVHEDCGPWRASHRGVAEFINTLRTVILSHIKNTTNKSNGDAASESRVQSEWSLPLSRDACITLINSPLLTHAQQSTDQQLLSVTEGEFLWALASVGTRTVYTPPMHGGLTYAGGSVTSTDADATTSPSSSAVAGGLTSWSALNSYAQKVVLPALRPTTTADTANSSNATEISGVLGRDASKATVSSVGDIHYFAHILSSLQSPSGPQSLGPSAFAAALTALSRFALAPRPLGTETALLRPPQLTRPLPTPPLSQRNADNTQASEADDETARVAALSDCLTLCAANAYTSTSKRSSGPTAVYVAPVTPTCALVPFFDLLNHSSDASVAVSWSYTTTSSLASTAATESASRVWGPEYDLSLEQGSIAPKTLFNVDVDSVAAAAVDHENMTGFGESEAFITYGPLTNLTLLQRYGFALSTPTLPVSEARATTSTGPQVTTPPLSLSSEFNKHDRVRVSLRFVERLLAQTTVAAAAGAGACPLQATQQQQQTSSALATSKSASQSYASSGSSSSSSSSNSLLAALPSWQHSLLTACGLYSISAGHVFEVSSTGLPWDLWLYLSVRLLSSHDLAHWSAGKPTAAPAPVLAVLSAADGAAALFPSQAAATAPATASASASASAGRALTANALAARARATAAVSASTAARRTTAASATGTTAAPVAVSVATVRSASEALLADAPLDANHGVRVRALSLWLLQQALVCVEAASQWPQSHSGAGTGTGAKSSDCGCGWHGASVASQAAATDSSNATVRSAVGAGGGVERGWLADIFFKSRVWILKTAIQNVEKTE